MSPGSGPGQAALMEVVADGANKRKEKAVTNLELFENYVRGGRHKRPLKLKQTVNMINGMLDGVFPGVPPELRVSMAQSRRQFEASVKRCVDQLPDLKKRILQPLGGAMTIDVIDPIRALATEPTKAAAPSE